MKWIPLSFAAAIFGSGAWYCQGKSWFLAGAVCGVGMIIFGLTALAEFVEHYFENASYIFERFRRARATTPVVAIAEAIRDQHPENAKILLRFTARAVWDVKIDMDKRERDVMLRGTNIHLGFVEFLLNNSRNGQLYPRNRLSEGSYEWDAYKQVTDYEQHKEFELWLSSRLIVAREFDNAPAVFLPPWTPELVKEVMGIKDQIEFYIPPQKIVAKPLKEAVPKPTAEASPEKVRKEAPLTDEDMKKIAELERARRELSTKDYLKQVGKS